MKDERNVFERRPHDGPSYKQSELPPFANCAKDGAPTVFLASARAKAWATRPLPVPPALPRHLINPLLNCPLLLTGFEKYTVALSCEEEPLLER